MDAISITVSHRASYSDTERSALNKAFVSAHRRGIFLSARRTPLNFYLPDSNARVMMSAGEGAYDRLVVGD